GVRNRVGAAVTQWLATQYPPCGQNSSSPWAETGHGNARVAGTAGVKATMAAEQGTQEALVASQQEQDQTGHRVHKRPSSVGVVQVRGMQGLPTTELQAITANRRPTMRLAWQHQRVPP